MGGEGEGETGGGGEGERERVSRWEGKSASPRKQATRGGPRRGSWDPAGCLEGPVWARGRTEDAGEVSEGDSRYLPYGQWGAGCEATGASPGEGTAPAGSGWGARAGPRSAYAGRPSPDGSARLVRGPVAMVMSSPFLALPLL